MYPIVFEPFGFAVSSFGVMLAVGFLVGTWLAGRYMAERGISPDAASTMLFYCMIGGVLGAKLYYAVDHAIRLPDASFGQLLLARDGLTFYGGLIGAIAAGYAGTRIHKIPTFDFANAAGLAAAVGQALGRIGCLLVGDDYGRPTDLPWGIAFPEGAPPIDIPVHPTQIYESAWLFGVTALLWRRRKKSPFLFAEYMMLNGIGRFAVEIWRINPRVALGMSEAQWIAIALMLVGCAAWFAFYRRNAGSAAR